MVAQADVLVVSATPHEALQREWDEHDLAKYVVAICGQEIGTKKECLQSARQYPPCHTLMIGDAPGDHKAAVANGALFFPINPGAEEASWQRLLDEGLQRFFDGAFAGKYQDDLLAEFDRYLPELPPWKTETTGQTPNCKSETPNKFKRPMTRPNDKFWSFRSCSFGICLGFRDLRFEIFPRSLL